MSTDLRDRLADAYPQTGVGIPPVEQFWERGRRRRHHRAAGVAVAVTSVVVAAGVAVVSLDSPAAPQTPVLTTPSDDRDERPVDEPTQQEEQPVPEPVNPGDVAVSEGDVPEVRDAPDIDAPDDAEEQGTPASSEQINLYDGLEQGEDPAEHGWSPSPPPIDLDPLNVREDGPQWYLDESAEYGLVGLDGIGERLGSREAAEALCGYLREEKGTADAMVPSGVADTALVVHHVKNTHGAEMAGDGLTLALARACFL